MEGQKEVLRGAIGQIKMIALKHREGSEKASSVAVEHLVLPRKSIAVSHLLAHWAGNWQFKTGK